MITVEEHQKTLSAKGIYLPDEQVEVLLNLKYKLALVFHTDWKMKTRQNTIVGISTVVHKKNGDCISIQSFAFVYTYA